MIKFARTRYFALGLLLSVSVIAIAETVSWFGKGSPDNVGFSLITLLAGEDQTLNKMNVNVAGSYKQMTATGAVKASAGALVGFFLASSTSCTVQLHDDPDSATAPIVLNTTAALTVLGWYPLPATFTTGLYFTEGGTCDITFVYY